MVTYSKKEMVNLSNLHNSYFSIESFPNFLILNTPKKYNSRKMNTTKFSKVKIDNKHHIISSYHTGDLVCDRCGMVFGRIYNNGAGNHTDPRKRYLYKTPNKFSKRENIQEYLGLISSTVINLDLPLIILNRSMNYFLKATDIIDIKNKHKDTKELYALSCILYSLNELHCMVFPKELLGACYHIIKKKELKIKIHNFSRIYHDLTDKLQLKKLVLGPAYYLHWLSEKFTINKNCVDMVKTILTKTTKNLSPNKQMNSGIAAGVFYVNSKINNLQISQEQIANELRISTGTVCEYTKEINGVLSGMYCKKRKSKLKDKDFLHLKRELGKFESKYK
uniref:Transcription initiation factor IIB n=1 Tax=Promethearchaeum syntrophicum TaxID=2594042 RepID=A0A5B9DF87_9ARCH|nr:hypothetical protein [Candidatus Prometheoarchaeum syntrophicum]QEE17715.1 transcription initiation factor IIB [Candidatus Prometheoarchaeum syntrophicum]